MPWPSMALQRCSSASSWQLWSQGRVHAHVTRTVVVVPPWALPPLAH